MNNVKPKNIPLSFHLFSSGVYPCNMEETIMSHVLYASWKYKVCDGKVLYVQVLDISYAGGVVSGHMTNPGKAVKWVLRYFRGTCCWKVTTNLG
jgi:hypothetical protein